MAKPTINLAKPSTKSFNVSFRFNISLATVSYLTIGPAINCGKKEIYNPTFKIFFCTCPFSLYTSITYDIAWNVKNEIPIGSAIVGIVLFIHNKSHTIFDVKFKYLNTNNIPKFTRQVNAIINFVTLILFLVLYL